MFSILVEEEYWDWDEDTELGGGIAAVSMTVGNVIPNCSSSHIYNFVIFRIASPKLATSDSSRIIYTL